MSRKVSGNFAAKRHAASMSISPWYLQHDQKTRQTNTSLDPRAQFRSLNVAFVLLVLLDLLGDFLFIVVAEIVMAISITSSSSLHASGHLRQSLSVKRLFKPPHPVLTHAAWHLTKDHGLALVDEHTLRDLDL